MKNLLLLGDSIRVGYCNMVKEMLDGKANVFFRKKTAGLPNILCANCSAG